ncbi:DUF2695 domain-containing protein [Clostridium sp. HMP27]|uniref:DUF2695 domain-containing protein n=1 Tax=Clostridium sp. HMP27 TaxID=1487921 RepID=UPI00052DF254|nr:DUF2695 domain-containing protein [Clostridium sp. HMP27]KGK90126.1 hypothetical protein DP68_01505 [Clostridium sp. HMP27]
MDKNKKKELKQKYYVEQKMTFVATLPFSSMLFDYLDEILGEHGCDDTLKYTIKFLEDNELPIDESLNWLQDNGVFCDCEVLANIEDNISEI